MQNTEIEVSMEDERTNTASAGVGRRRSKRDRKRRLPDTEVAPVTPRKQASHRGSRGHGKKESKTPSFVDVSASTEYATAPENLEKIRQLVERLNEISAEKETIERLKREREQGGSDPVRTPKMSGQFQPQSSAVSASPSAAMHSKDVTIPGRVPTPKPETQISSATVVPDLEFSPDLRKRMHSPAPSTPCQDHTDQLAMSPATRAKRQRTPSILLTTQPGESQPVATPVPRSRQYQFCQRVVRDILKNKDSISFSQPVLELWQPEAIPGYNDIIKHPMDLKTVLRKMDNGEYGPNPETRLEEFDSELWAQDMRLIFQNAMTYNRAGDPIYQAAQNLVQKFERKFLDLPSKDDVGSPRRGLSKKKKVKSAEKKKHSRHHKKRDGDDLEGEISREKARRPKSRSPNEQPEEDSDLPSRDIERKLVDLKRQQTIMRALQSPSASPRTPNYAIQAAALYDLPMTYEEKRELGENINKLPGEKLGKLIEIVAKRTGKAEMNKDEEIELDIDAMDNKTLREMEAFVNSVVGRKKSLTRRDSSMTLPQVNAEVARLTNLLQRKKAEEQSQAQKGGLLDLQSSSSESESGSGSGSSSSSDSESSEGDTGDVLQKRQQRERAYRQMSQASPRMLSSPPMMGNRLHGTALVGVAMQRKHAASPSVQSGTSSARASEVTEKGSPSLLEKKTDESHPVSGSKGMINMSRTAAANDEVKVYGLAEERLEKVANSRSQAADATVTSPAKRAATAVSQKETTSIDQPDVRSSCEKLGETVRGSGRDGVGGNEAASGTTEMDKVSASAIATQGSPDGQEDGNMKSDKTTVVADAPSPKHSSGSSNDERAASKEMNSEELPHSEEHESPVVAEKRRDAPDGPDNLTESLPSESLQTQEAANVAGHVDVREPDTPRKDVQRDDMVEQGRPVKVDKRVADDWTGARTTIDTNGEPMTDVADDGSVKPTSSRVKQGYISVDEAVATANAESQSFISEADPSTVAGETSKRSTEQQSGQRVADERGGTNRGTVIDLSSPQISAEKGQEDQRNAAEGMLELFDRGE